MKSIILSLLCFASSLVFAAEVGEITMVTPKSSAVSTDKNNSTEAGISFSSINNGSNFADVAFIHEWDNGFALGVRGFLPIQYSREGQIFMVQAAARFILLNEVDQMFVEGTITQGFMNGAGNQGDGTPFAMLGANYGYLHKFTSYLGAGANVGIDYSNQRIEDNFYGTGRTLYSKLGLSGIYYF